MRRLPALMVVVRRSILAKPIVISRIPLAPTGVGVIARLIRQHWLIVDVVEPDLAIVVRALPFSIHVTELIAGVRAGAGHPSGPTQSVR
jgi:hypothetical protein